MSAPYIPLLEKLLDRDTSIISSNCFAGRVMQDLDMQYNTPTLGLYFMYPDYIEFLQHLEFYLKEAKITFVEHSKIRIRNGVPNGNIGIPSDGLMEKWKFSSYITTRKKRLPRNGTEGLPA